MKLFDYPIVIIGNKHKIILILFWLLTENTEFIIYLLKMSHNIFHFISFNILTQQTKYFSILLFYSQIRQLPLIMKFANTFFHSVYFNVLIVVLASLSPLDSVSNVKFVLNLILEVVILNLVLTIIIYLYEKNNSITL